jgi:hypothetical protein
MKRRGICKHNKQRCRCMECGGFSICKHKRDKYSCTECRGNGICEHGRRRHDCKQCGGFPVLAKLLHQTAKIRANKKGLPFNITIADVLMLIGDGFCPVLGTPYNLSSRKITDTSANLDRFIPSLGYVLGNCTVLSKLANNIKQNATAEQVYRVADWMASRDS